MPEIKTMTYQVNTILLLFYRLENQQAEVSQYGKGHGRRPKNPLKFDMIDMLQIFVGIFILKCM